MATDFQIRLTNFRYRMGERVSALLTWRWQRGEHWRISGPNGVGKSSFLRSLWGGVPQVGGQYFFQSTFGEQLTQPALARPHIGYVGFELQQTLFHQLESRAESDFFAGHAHRDLGRQLVQSALTGDQLEQVSAQWDRIVDQTAVASLLDKPWQHCSDGERMRLLIARALLKNPQVLLLDEPFNHLDSRQKDHLHEVLQSLAGKLPILIVTHHEAEVPDFVTDEFGLIPDHSSRINPSSFEEPDLVTPDLKASEEPPAGESIRMEQVCVEYGGKVIINNLDWIIQPGQQWAITGPNGAGKTTLLKLITGEHPQAYSNHIWVFGQRWGEGSVVSAMREGIRLITARMHYRYQNPIAVREVVASGWRDSIGLFAALTPGEWAAVDQMMAQFDLIQFGQRQFQTLSQGEQRRVLIARALVSRPRLLLLDEPFVGLDATRVDWLKARLEITLARSSTQVIQVVHREEERLGMVKHELKIPLNS